MTTTHTPGPWINDGAEISARPDPENSQSYIAPICVMDSEWHPDTAAANARLISAAPDLLAALIAAEKELAYYASTRRSDELPRIRAAIAKAGGAA
jgi:hypothetical protein